MNETVHLITHNICFDFRNIYQNHCVSGMLLKHANAMGLDLPIP